MLKRCDFFIEPRQSGKTYSLIKLLKYSIPSAIMIVSNRNCVDAIKEEYSIGNQIVTTDEFVNRFVSLDFIPHVLIDEYLFFSQNNIKMLNTLLPLKAKRITIKTTSNKLYDRDLFDLAKAYRKVSKLKNVYINFYNDHYSIMFQDLCHNLLTHPKTIVHDDLTKIRYKNQESFKTEMLGKIFKEEDDE